MEEDGENDDQQQTVRQHPQRDQDDDSHHHQHRHKSEAKVEKIVNFMTHILNNIFSHYLTRCEIDVIKTSWYKLIGDETGSHGINMFIK